MAVCWAANYQVSCCISCVCLLTGSCSPVQAQTQTLASSLAASAPAAAPGGKAAAGVCCLLHGCLPAWKKMLHGAAHPLTTGRHARTRVSQGSVPTPTPNWAVQKTCCCCSMRIEQALTLWVLAAVWRIRLSQLTARSGAAGLLRVAASCSACVVCSRCGQMPPQLLLPTFLSCEVGTTARGLDTHSSLRNQHSAIPC